MQSEMPQASRLPLQEWSCSIEYHDFALIRPICRVIDQSSSELDCPVHKSTFLRSFRCSGVRDQKIQVARAAASPWLPRSLALVRQPTLKEQSCDHLGRKSAHDQA